MAPPEEQSSDNPPDGPSMTIQQVLSGPTPDDGPGQGLLFKTTLGDLGAILHQSEGSNQAVVWVCGARGGFGGPGPGTYARLAERFKDQGITSLRLDYRRPNDLEACVLDLLAGVAFLRATGYGPAVVVGHSFGGAVVVAAGAAGSHIKGVVSLSPQTYGASMAGMISPAPLLVVHGKADTRLPFRCAEQIYEWAQEPKQLVLYEGAEHRLEECRDELEELLSDWIPATLAAPLPVK
jgi:alpha/beta superfamily hydrolase